MRINFKKATSTRKFVLYPLLIPLYQLYSFILIAVLIFLLQTWSIFGYPTMPPPKLNKFSQETTLASHLAKSWQDACAYEIFQNGRFGNKSILQDLARPLFGKIEQEFLSRTWKINQDQCLARYSKNEQDQCLARLSARFRKIEQDHYFARLSKIIILQDWARSWFGKIKQPTLYPTRVLRVQHSFSIPKRPLI